MKILYHHRIASKDGQYVHVEELTRALRRLGHEVIVIGPPGMEKRSFGAESRFVTLLKRRTPAFAYEVLELCYSLIAYRRLAMAVRAHRPDCLYERYNLYMLAGVWIKRVHKLPLLLEVNAPLFLERDRHGGIALKRLAQWSELYVWRNADRVLPVTRVLAALVQQASVAPHRIIVIPNGIDPETFGARKDSSEAKTRLNLQGQFVLGFAGFVREWHGLERMVDMLAHDPTGDRHLLVVGDGPARPAIEARAAALGVTSRVTLTGVVERRQIAQYLAAFDVALQPEVVAYASPLKLFEYMGLGKPVIAPDQANIREVLTHEHDALLFDPGDRQGLAKAVERLCADSSLRRRIAENAHRTIHERGYIWQNNARRVVALFEEAGVRSPQTGGLAGASELEGQ